MFFSIHQGFPIDPPQIWERYTITKLTNMGEKYFQESDLRIWVKNMFRKAEDLMPRDIRSS